MERLLVLRLESLGCEAEAALNGVPLLRTTTARPVSSRPVHEFAVGGGNELELVVRPAPAGAPAVPQPWLADGRCAASVRLLLPRHGQVAHPSHARTVAQLDWAPPDGELYEAPLALRSSVALPIAFPRWRWCDAPPVPDPEAVRAAAAAFVLDIAAGLARGDPEPLLQSTRLRLEELAAAYARPLAADAARLREQVRTLHAAQPLKPPLPSASTLVLRPVAGGRLLECLDGAGGPWLRSAAADGGDVAWPLRLAVVEGRFYGLR